ncbi:MAG: glycosyltransferase family 9 protein [Planctomycetota bacterium]|jgi:lipopolysaccharide heptosyltransferase I
MADPTRILIVRPSALGDVCRTVPVLATLRRAWPQAAIDWVVQADFAAAIEAHPALTEAVRFPRQKFARWWRSPAVARELVGWLADLGRRRYDLVVDCQGLSRSGFITWVTRAPRRVGPRRARELGWLGYNVRHPVPDTMHTVRQMMSLLEAEGLEPVYDMRLYVSEADRAWWNRRRDALGMASGAFAVLAPTTRWASKRWPLDRWAQLVGPLGERGLRHAALIGAPSERQQVQQIIERAPAVVDLVGEATLGQAMAVIADSSLVVANDSAPLHMAVGLDRPCVGLYGPTDPAVVGPWGADDAVVRADGPAGRRNRRFRDRRLGDELMRLIRPSEVLERVDRVMGRATATTPDDGGPAATDHAPVPERAVS